jgi:hypothetical protein
MAVAGAAVFLLVGVRSRFGASAPTVGPLHFTQDLPPGTSLASGGLLSPDSRYLVFVAQDENSGKTQLWLRALDSADARPVDGTEGASRPFWSPDGQFIGFFSGARSSGSASRQAASDGGVNGRREACGGRGARAA